MMLVRHSLFYSVPDNPPPRVRIPTTGTNLQRRSDSMLRQPLNRRNTLAVCNPLIRITASWVIVFNRSSNRHRILYKPLCTNGLLSNIGPEPKDCWLPSVINLGPLPASLYPPSLTEITARCMVVRPCLDRPTLSVSGQIISGEPSRALMNNLKV